MPITQVFSNGYLEARAKFLAAAARAGFSVTSLQNPCRGPAGERLFTDIGYRGPDHAQRILLVISATHGVEGHCGSGIQVGSLEEGVFASLPPSTGVVLIHALNPFGFAWGS